MFGLLYRCHDSHHLFTACLGMDDSNYQTFASGFFFSLADYQTHWHFESLQALI